MANAPVTISQFGGLNLAEDPTKVGATAATACSDVAFDIPGQIRTREGYSVRATTTTAPTRVHVFDSVSAGLFNYITSSATKLETFDAFGVAAATVATASGPHSMTTYGTSAASVVYATNVLDAVRKWNGAAWAVVAAAPIGRSVTFTQNSNRLVIGGHQLGNRVQFSDAGAPDTWTATSWVDITPGDGELLDMVIGWRDLVFAFKRSKFAVFYGESVDGSGNPVFNYRLVNGVGTLQGQGGTACASPGGVYFISSQGIYHTTGDAPTLVSGPIQSLFGSTTSAGSYITTGQHIWWCRGRLYVVLQEFTRGTNVYVLEEATGQWSVWSMFSGKVGGGFASGPSGSSPTFVNGTDLKLYRLGSNWTTDGGAFSSDNGTAISWSYTSGKYPLSEPGHVAITRESSLFGTGTATLTLSSDRYADQSGSVTLGTAPTPATGWLQKDQEGRYFQHTLSGTGVATVESLTHNVAGIRAPEAE